MVTGDRENGQQYAPEGEIQLSAESKVETLPKRAGAGAYCWPFSLSPVTIGKIQRQYTLACPSEEARAMWITALQAAITSLSNSDDVPLSPERTTFHRRTSLEQDRRNSLDQGRRSSLEPDKGELVPPDPTATTATFFTRAGGSAKASSSTSTSTATRRRAPSAPPPAHIFAAEREVQAAQSAQHNSRHPLARAQQTTTCAHPAAELQVQTAREQQKHRYRTKWSSGPSRPTCAARPPTTTWPTARKARAGREK
eukprot:g8373.t1